MASTSKPQYTSHPSQTLWDGLKTVLLAEQCQRAWFLDQNMMGSSNRGYSSTPYPLYVWRRHIWPVLLCSHLTATISNKEGSRDQTCAGFFPPTSRQSFLQMTQTGHPLIQFSHIVWRWHQIPQVKGSVLWDCLPTSVLGLKLQTFWPTGFKLGFPGLPLRVKLNCWSGSKYSGKHICQFAMNDITKDTEEEMHSAKNGGSGTEIPCPPRTHHPVETSHACSHLEALQAQSLWVLMKASLHWHHWLITGHWWLTTFSSSLLPRVSRVRQKISTLWSIMSSGWWPVPILKLPRGFQPSIISIQKDVTLEILRILRIVHQEMS